MDPRTPLSPYSSAYRPAYVDSLQWPSDHLGPVSTFMASCNGDCSNFKAADGKWFKIDAAGYTNGKWASQKLIAGTSECYRHSELLIDLLAL